jgi:hypothetical protein
MHATVHLAHSSGPLASRGNQRIKVKRAAPMWSGKFCRSMWHRSSSNEDPLDEINSAKKYLAMHYSRIVVISALFAGCNAAVGKDLTTDPFLRPYVEKLKKQTPKDNLNRISAMAKSELILLHLNYGMWIRNTWIRGNRDPALVQFFQSKGINDPDEMSMILIEALWQDLNSRLTPQERATVARKREIVARKRKAYDKLETECESQLVKASGEFESAYAKFGPPTDNLHVRWTFLAAAHRKDGTGSKDNLFRQ